MCCEAQSPSSKPFSAQTAPRLANPGTTYPLGHSRLWCPIGRGTESRSWRFPGFVTSRSPGRRSTVRWVTEVFTRHRGRIAPGPGEQSGDRDDAGSARETESVSVALTADLREQLAAVERAEERITRGTYGRSVESGVPIPDERLEVQPLAERTIQEQRHYERHGPK